MSLKISCRWGLPHDFLAGAEQRNLAVCLGGTDQHLCLGHPFGQQQGCLPILEVGEGPLIFSPGCLISPGTRRPARGSASLYDGLSNVRQLSVCVQ